MAFYDDGDDLVTDGNCESDLCFRNGVVNDSAPQCRIHGKIANFEPFGHHFGSNFGITPGGGHLPHQQPAQPFHPGLHLNNWAKNFPPQDEVRFGGFENDLFWSWEN